MKKRSLRVLLFSVMLMLLCLPQTGFAASAKATHIKFSWVTPVEGTTHRLFYDKLSEKVSEYTNGEIVIDPYGGGALGGEKDVAEALLMGTVDMMLTGVSVLSYWTKDFEIFDLPGLLDNYDHANRVYDSPFVSSKFPAMEQKGWHVFRMVDVGFREFVSRIRIDKPEDAVGKNFRVPETPMLTEFYKAMDINPVTIAYNEVYTALSNGTFDAVDMPVPTHYSNKFYEAGKYFYRLYLTPTTDLVLYSKILWDKLSPAHQDAITRAVDDAVDYLRANITDLEQKCINEMEKEGITIVYPDMNAWYEKIRNVAWPKMYKSGFLDESVVKEVRSYADKP